MSNISVFCSFATLDALLDRYENEPFVDCDIVVDFIDAPYTFVMGFDDENWYLKAFLRQEWFFPGGSDIKRADFTVSKENQSAIGEFKDSFVRDNIMTFFQGVQCIGKYMHENKTFTLMDNLDALQQGLLIEKQIGGFTASVVSGKERPDLSCLLPGGVSPVMRRPYMAEN